MACADAETSEGNGKSGKAAAESSTTTATAPSSSMRPIQLPDRLGLRAPHTWTLNVLTRRNGEVCVRARLLGVSEAGYDACNPDRRINVVAFHLRCDTREALQLVLAPRRVRSVQSPGKGRPPTIRRYRLPSSVRYPGALYAMTSVLDPDLRLRQMTTLDIKGRSENQFRFRTIESRCDVPGEYVSG